MAPSMSRNCLCYRKEKAFVGKVISASTYLLIRYYPVGIDRLTSVIYLQSYAYVVSAGMKMRPTSFNYI